MAQLEQARESWTLVLVASAGAGRPGSEAGRRCTATASSVPSRGTAGNAENPTIAVSRGQPAVAGP
jgi:hypothetical protein